ncbi:amidohydrolase family protein [Thiohalophilus thiocyanatoxydans]|uniref:Putative TIM-barrel fold metal-dependent hydrolase n=1 Tax=Thiohalophilus thiocyanatoxydans TaxID=381308 RepID=A0A4V3H4L4_9GAMM|nr:TatD family hydrolase [Thiohalophilus thiocyanatoxydans]TDY03655.1 putative TIM-barrel fold metal-dependent hydrolase [Thiohalophilus thiocyanatoxydans]
MNKYLLLLPLFLVISSNLFSQPLVDAHVHYNDSNRDIYSPEQIISIFEKNNISQAFVTAMPAQNAATLYQTDADRIIPFLGVYKQPQDKQNWHQDTSLPDYIEKQLEDGPWRGIGELHIFAKDRHSPVLHRLIQLAAQHKLPLLMHSDPAVIDTIYETEPGVTVIWAHAGAYPYPDLLDDYLQRYPELYVDVSVRNDRIAPNGQLADKWYNLFIQHPERFLVGVDTYSTQRWGNYHAEAALLRQWLKQLPSDVADRLAYRNAERLLTHQDRSK